MRCSSIVILSCVLAALACRGGAVGERDSFSLTTETRTLNQGGSYSHRVGQRQWEPGQPIDEAEWTAYQAMRIDCKGSDVLLVWGETAVRFPGIWPAVGPLVVKGTFDDPPLRLGFPSPLDGQADGTAVKSVMWSSDELIVDGVTFELAAGTDYLFSGEGLEVSASATDGE